MENATFTDACGKRREVVNFGAQACVSAQTPWSEKPSRMSRSMYRHTLGVVDEEGHCRILDARQHTRRLLQRRNKVAREGHRTGVSETGACGVFSLNIMHQDEHGQVQTAVATTSVLG